MTRRSPLLRAAPSSRSQDAPHGGSAQSNRFPLGQQLRQVLIIAASIEPLSERNHAIAQAGSESMGRSPPPVAVHQRRWPISHKRTSEAPYVPLRQTHQFRRLTGGQPPFYHPCQNHCSSLFLPVHRDVLHVDRITELLDRTKSQTIYRVGW